MAASAPSIADAGQPPSGLSIGIERSPIRSRRPDQDRKAALLGALIVEPGRSFEASVSSARQGDLVKATP
jgi:hypothetical protein